MPTGSKACFNRRCSAIMPAGKGWKTSSSPTAPQYSVACPPAAAAAALALEALHQADFSVVPIQEYLQFRVAARAKAAVTPS